MQPYCAPTQRHSRRESARTIVSTVPRLRGRSPESSGSYRGFSTCATHSQCRNVRLPTPRAHGSPGRIWVGWIEGSSRLRLFMFRSGGEERRPVLPHEAVCDAPQQGRVFCYRLPCGSGGGEVPNRSRSVGNDGYAVGPANSPALPPRVTPREHAPHSPHPWRGGGCKTLSSTDS